MIMYRVSKKFSMVQFAEIEVISQTEKMVTYLTEEYQILRKSRKKTNDTEWFKYKENAIGIAREWADIKLGAAKLGLNIAQKSRDNIEIIALAEDKQ